MKIVLNNNCYHVITPPIFRGLSTRKKIDELENKLANEQLPTVFDMKHTTFIDSAAISHIVEISKLLKKQDQILLLINCEQNIKKLLLRLNLDKWINIQ